MFKYIKTIHSHTIAETCKRSVYNNLVVSKGTLCQVTNGILGHGSATTKPFYLVLEDKKENDGKTSLDCIRLLPGMILVGTSDYELSSLTVGGTCGFTTDQNEHCTQISSTGTAAEVVDIEGDLVTIIIN